MKWIGFILFGSISLAGCAQQNLSGVQRVDAFMQVSIPGTIPIVPGQDRRRSYADTVYVIYMQAKQTPVWTKAWNANRTFRVETTETNDTLVVVGIEKATGQEVRLPVTNGLRLYRLVLKKEADNGKPESTVNEGEMLLKGEAKGKSIFYTVRRFTELQSPMYQ